MKVRNENMQIVEMNTIANEILIEGLGFENVTENDAKNALAELYIESQKNQYDQFFLNQNKTVFNDLTIQSLNLDNLWKQLKEVFCSIVKEDSIYNKIIDFVLEAISLILGGLGVFIKKLVKIIIKFLFQEGVNLACGII